MTASFSNPTMMSALQITFAGVVEPFVRWEYEQERGPGGSLWSRNHTQGEQQLQLRPGLTRPMTTSTSQPAG